jgi:hypothetical protein
VAPLARWLLTNVVGEGAAIRADWSAGRCAFSLG